MFKINIFLSPVIQIEETFDAHSGLNLFILHTDPPNIVPQCLAAIKTHTASKYKPFIAATL